MGQSLGDVLRPPKPPSESSMKSGPNFKEVNRIREMAAKGSSAEEISTALNIHIGPIEAHMRSLVSGSEDGADSEDE